MAPPAYGDLGKSAKDLFNKHYHIGVVKLDLKSKTPTGVEFTVNGVSNNDTGRVASSLETKYNIKPHGIVLKQKWNTDNILVGEITGEDYLVRGLKLGLSTTLAPQSGKKSGKVTCGFKSPCFNLNGDVDLDYSRATFNGAGVFGYLGWLAGMKMTFDPSKNKLSKSNFALGYEAPEFHVTGHLDDGQEFNCSIYQRLNDQLETGINVSWSSNSSSTNFNLGCLYKIDKESAVKAKVTSSSQVGLGFIHRLRPGVNVTLSALMDAKNFSQGGHKLGLGLDFET